MRVGTKNYLLLSFNYPQSAYDWLFSQKMLIKVILETEDENSSGHLGDKLNNEAMGI